jgi:hypothetical protein
MKRKKKKTAPAGKPGNFLSTLHKQFFDANHAPVWPTSTTSGGQAAQARTQMKAALSAMITATEKKKAPTGPGGPNTALGKVKAAAAATLWPTASKVPAKWASRAAFYRRYEAAKAIVIMTEALARSGGGGGPKDWPGHGGGH